MNPRRGNGRRFKAMQRRRRLDGDLEDWRTRPRPVRGSFSSLSERLEDHANRPSRPIEPGQPPNRKGSCPDCDRGGPAAMVLIPGEQCGFCGGYPAGEHDD